MALIFDSISHSISFLRLYGEEGVATFELDDAASKLGLDPISLITDSCMLLLQNKIVAFIQLPYAWLPRKWKKSNQPTCRDLYGVYFSRNGKYSRERTRKRLLLIASVFSNQN